MIPWWLVAIGGLPLLSTHMAAGARVAHLLTIRVGGVFRDCGLVEGVEECGVPCGAISVAPFIDRVNLLNDGKGFAIQGAPGVEGEPYAYAKLEYTQRLFGRTDWETSGRVDAEEVFGNVAYVVGQGSGCNDRQTIDQMQIADRHQGMPLSACPAPHRAMGRTDPHPAPPWTPSAAARCCLQLQ